MTRPTSLSVVLHLGSRGPDVERVQGALKARGYFEGECNGLFGVDTEQAVQNFQRQTGLRVDGTVGPEVRSALLRDERLEQAAQAAIHASVQATSVPGGVGVGGVESKPAPAQPQVQPPPVPMVPQAGNATKGGLLLVGGLIGLGVLLMWAGGEAEPKSFGDFEDDSGLPPIVPGLDGEDDEGDATVDEETDGGADPGPTPSDSALAGAPTGIVPYGGGAPLKRGAKGRFLPRGA